MRLLGGLRKFWRHRNLDKFERKLLAERIDGLGNVIGTKYSAKEVFIAAKKQEYWLWNLCTSQVEAAIIYCRGHLREVGRDQYRSGYF